MKILIKLTESHRKVDGKVFFHLTTVSVSPLVNGILDKAFGLITLSIIEVVVYPFVISLVNYRKWNYPRSIESRFTSSNPVPDKSLAASNLISTEP